MRLRTKFLGLPALAWPLVSAGLAVAMIVLPPPGPPPAPAPVAEMFREPLLVTPSGDGYRVVPYGPHRDAGTVWAINLQTTTRSTVTRDFSLGVPPNPGLFHRSARWEFELTAVRFDDAARDAPGSHWMPAGEAAALRPLVVAELDRRSGGLWGKQLGDLLDRGAERRSWVCWQNVVILLAWLSLPLATAAIVAMAWRRPRVAVV